MQSALGTPSLRMAMAAILLIAASGTGVAHFASPAPGEDLAPLGEAGALIELVQGGEAILWKALEGTVSSHALLGWPSRDGIHDLGGGLVLERPDNASAGVIQAAEKPQSLTFSIEN